MSETKAAKQDDNRRFREILGILRRAQLTKGLTPEKVRSVLSDLGPTFVKFGQILSTRSDILPKEYCTALEELRTDAQPMPIEEVYDILGGQYGCDWQEIFAQINPVPLGSASIAQAHEALLADGRQVVIKVQRPGLYDTMQRDLRLMKRAAGVLKFTALGGALDFRKILDEMWITAQQELDFTNEAKNLREFADNNRDVTYARCPEVFEELCTGSVLVMERIGGHQIDDTEGLLADGYDLNEIATKLVHNYIKQITEDRFFHADPHPGNIRVEGGSIIWLDLGMMGRISKREADLYVRLITTMNAGDAMGLTDVLLSFGEYEVMPDRLALSSNVEAMLAKYQLVSMADMNLGSIVDEAVGILREYSVSVPSSLTMLGRSLLVVQGLLATISPELNLVEIVAEYVKNSVDPVEYAKKKVKKISMQLMRSGEKLTELPAQTSDFLRKTTGGQLVVNVKKSASAAENDTRYLLINRLILGAALCALLLASAVASLSGVTPLLCGVPWPAAAFFGAAVAVAIVLITGRKKRK